MANDNGYPILYHEENDVAYVELHRPASRNALDYFTLKALSDTVDRLRLNRAIRAVIFHGSGRGFCAGADLKERRTLSPDEVLRNVFLIRDTFTAIERLPQPTITVMHGFAFGGGLELALACDFRFAAEDTMMGLTETSLAIIPGAGGTQRLPKLIGPMQAKRLIFTAKRIDSSEANLLGLLTGISADKHSCLIEAENFAKAIAKNGPIAVSQAKFSIDRGLGTDIGTGLDIESKAYEVLIPTSDRIEALEAFKDKREPRFQGK